MKRRSLSPAAFATALDGAHAVQGALAMRRGGARHELTERVRLRPIARVSADGCLDGRDDGPVDTRGEGRPHDDGAAADGRTVESATSDGRTGGDAAPGAVLEGWALNISRGGVRVILEASVELGAEFEVTVGDEDPQLSTRGRIVWLQEEPDGVIVGVEFLGMSGLHRAPPFEPGTMPPPRA